MASTANRRPWRIPHTNDWQPKYDWDFARGKQRITWRISFLQIHIRIFICSELLWKNQNPPAINTASTGFPLSLLSYAICLVRILHSEVANLTIIRYNSGNSSKKPPVTVSINIQAAAGTSLWKLFSSNIWKRGTATYSSTALLF